MRATAVGTIDATDPARVEACARSADASAEVPLGSSSEDALLEPGAKAGDFLIEDVLGRGTFGTVYRGVHAVIGRRVAIKVLREQGAGESRVASFVEEARLVARLRHPNIVDVMTYGRLDDGRHFHVMDLIDGPTLTEHMREHGAVALERALPILRGIASAVDAVHLSGIAHRDLKPANVVLEPRDGQLVPKLIDFGIAELIERREGEGERALRSAGTPRYMSPEQCRGDAVDARADVYAFGLIAYELLTGRPPFDSEDALELMLMHTSRVPPPPSSVQPALPARLDAIVLRLLSKNAEDRPSELGAVVEELQLLVGGEPRKRGLWLGVSALALVGATGVWAVTSSARNVDPVNAGPNVAAPNLNTGAVEADAKPSVTGLAIEPTAMPKSTSTATLTTTASSSVSSVASTPARPSAVLAKSSRPAGADPSDPETPENPFRAGEPRAR